MSHYPLQAQSVTLRYSPLDDRILLSFHNPSRRRVDAWITRRFLLQLLPQLSKWVENQVSPKSATEPLQGKDRLQFDYEISQLKIPHQPNHPAESLTPERVFVVAGMRISAHNQKIKLLITDRTTTELILLNVSRAELHKIMGQILQLANKANWRINNPFVAENREAERTPGPRALH